MITTPGVTLHAKRQMLERWGYEPRPEDWHRAVLDIIEGRTFITARHFEPETGYHYERHIVRIGPEAVCAVWCPETARMVTVTAPEHRAVSGRREYQQERGKRLARERRERRRHSVEIAA